MSASPSRFTSVGGRLCLMFANTLEGARGGRAIDRLGTYGDLLDWARHAGILTEVEAQALALEAGRRGSAAERVLDRAVTLREAIYHVITRNHHGQAPDPADLETLNQELVQSMTRARIAPTGGGFDLEWCPAGNFLDRVLWPVARSAAELMTGEDLDRVRECASDDCNDLFLDTSKNHRRRWCKMEACGNRAKARRFRDRRRVRGPAAGHAPG